MFILVWIKGATNITLLEFGAVTNVEPFAGEWWRYIASIFLHGEFTHLFSNSFAILIFTPPMERLLGHWRYIVLYLGSGIVANLIIGAVYERTAEHMLANGASAAVYGVFGAFLYVALFQRALMDEASRKTLYSLLIVFVIFSFLIPQVSWVGHLSGLASGFFIYGLIIRLLKRH
ncbi:Rhomboid protease GluP [compost metagenome]